MAERSTEIPVTLALRARGPRAFFPDEVRSPVSLPWPEPASCRALVESVLWKPRIRWVVREVHLLAPLRYERLPCPEDAPPPGRSRHPTRARIETSRSRCRRRHSRSLSSPNENTG